MTFSLEQLKAAHAKVKTGADFPKYIQEIKSLGLLTYEYDVRTGATIYFGTNGHTVNAVGWYSEPITVQAEKNAAVVADAIRRHQQGGSNFLTFCREVAAAGVASWQIDTRNMLCRYLDLNGNELVTEPIPDEAAC
ncbi:DUF1398 domain-containing protein [Terrimonas sp. NA20]|uniref:DUF1398 domain-containing protein n=1 Tax=Terrimonas ginsenosidimutans TaxID=2908004 RepID=A0ABS9KMA6_9BACT|nr:DUF1398 family protein [Terrimonas ginsenosidimutans]MCG2613425.1 DUF1398 domain-containing protein [Terrimonas ginsenosidimutans]